MWLSRRSRKRRVTQDWQPRLEALKAQAVAARSPVPVAYTDGVADSDTSAWRRRLDLDQGERPQFAVRRAELHRGRLWRQ